MTLTPIAELMLECIDAVHGAHYDPEDRREHISRSRAGAENASVPERVAAALSRAADFFETRAHAPSWMAALPHDEERAEVETLLSTIVEQYEWGRYVYHGTIYGKLESIVGDGLTPGRPSSWSQFDHLHPHCAQAVFFAMYWRTAATFAKITSAKSRGPKNGRHRQPVVIRLPSAGLNLEKDEFARMPSSMMVRAAVSVEGAEVFSGPLKGFPTWLPLADLIDAQRK